MHIVLDKISYANIILVLLNIAYSKMNLLHITVSILITK